MSAILCPVNYLSRYIPNTLSSLVNVHSLKVAICIVVWHFHFYKDREILRKTVWKCYELTLISYNISEKPITQTQQEILDEITANETYIFKISEQETEWRMGRKRILENKSCTTPFRV